MADADKSINVGVPADRWDEFKKWAAEKDKKSTRTFGRVIRWFLEQDKAVWDVITSDPDPRVLPAYATLFREMAAAIESQAAEQQNRTAVVRRNGATEVIEHQSGQ